MLDFILIGAGKSGTTSLYYYLAQHPDIFLARIKEPRFLLLPGLGETTAPAECEAYLKRYPNGVTSRLEYERLFSGAGPGQRRGEASIQYLPSEVAARNIAAYAPRARLFCVLRSPVERAFSNFAQFRRDGLEGRASVVDVLRQHGVKHPFFSDGFYGRYLEAYARLAPGNPLRVWLYDDLKADPLRTVQEIFGYLQVNPAFVPDLNFRANMSGEAEPGNRWAALYAAVRRSRWRIVARRLLPVSVKLWLVRSIARRADAGRRPLTMTAEERSVLADLYRDDVARLQDRLGRDLSHWLREGP